MDFGKNIRGVAANEIPTAQAVIPQANAIIPAPEPTEGELVLTNIPSDEEHLEMLINASSGSDKFAKNCVGKMLYVRHYYAHQLQREDMKTGEVFIGWRVVLVTEQGEMIACSGPAIRRAIYEIVRVKGNKPWSPPICCEIKANKGNGTNEYHTLKLVKSPSSTPATPERKRA